MFNRSYRRILTRSVYYSFYSVLIVGDNVRKMYTTNQLRRGFRKRHDIHDRNGIFSLLFRLSSIF